jgi:hypothetical protein
MTAMNPGPGPADQTRSVRGPGPAAAAGGLGSILGLVVLATGLLIALVGFADFFDTNGLSGYSTYGVVLSLFAGLLAGTALLPKQTVQAGTVAAASVAGFVLVLFVVLGSPAVFSLAFGGYATILLTLVQAAAAVFALLLSTGIVSAPAPKPAPSSWQTGPYGAPAQPAQYGPPGQQGQYGGPPSFGGPQGGPSGPPPFGRPQGGPPPHGQPGQYGQPGPQGPPAPGYGGPQGGPPPQGDSSPWTKVMQGRPDQGRPDQGQGEQPSPQQAPGASSSGPPTQAFGAPGRDTDDQPDPPSGAPRT